MFNGCFFVGNYFSYFGCMKILLLIGLLMPAFCFSQKKLIKIDGLTGDTSYYTEQFYLYGKKGMLAAFRPSISFIVLQKKEGLFLEVIGAHEGRIITSLAVGDSISFRLKSKKIVSIPYVIPSTTDYPVGTNYKTTYFNQVLLIDDDIINALSDEPIEFIRVNTDAQSFDYEVDADKQTSLAKAFALFTN